MMQHASSGQSAIVVSPALHVILACAGVVVTVGGIYLISSAIGVWGGPVAGSPHEPAWRSLLSGALGCVLGVSIAVPQTRLAVRGFRRRRAAAASASLDEDAAVRRR